MVLPAPASDAQLTKKSQLVLQKHYHDLDAIGERLRELKTRHHEIRSLHKHRKQPVSLRKVYKIALRRFVDSRKSKYVKRQEAVDDLSCSRFRPLEGRCKVLVVVRNTRKCPTKELRVILHELGLSTFDTGVLLPNSREIRLKLKMVESYVYFGLPSSDTIRQILMKRALLKSAQEDQPAELITSNVMIEERFEQDGLLSIEDLVHELYLGGAACPTILKSLLPFAIGSAKKIDPIGTKTRSGLQKDLNELLPKIV